jgi:hypothetical protein
MQLKFYFTFFAADVSSLLRRNAYQQDKLSPRSEVALFAFTKSSGASRRQLLAANVMDIRSFAALTKSQLPQNVHLQKNGRG